MISRLPKHLSFYFIHIILVLPLMVSCSSELPFDTAEDISILPINRNINKKEVKILNDGMLNLNEVEIVNNQYLILIDERSESIFNVFQLPEIKYLYSWGKEGRGPGEIINLGYVNSNDKYLYVYDADLLHNNKYLINDNTMTFINNDILALDEGSQLFDDITLVNDTLYVGENGGFSGDEEFVFLKPGSRIVSKKFGRYPSSDLQGYRRANEFTKLIAGKPDGSRFVAFFHRYNALKIFDSHGNLLQFNKWNDPHAEHEIIRSDVEATEEYVVVRAYHATKNDFENGNYQEYESLIEVWNWEGEQLRRFRITDFLSHMAVNGTNNKIYGAPIYNGDSLYIYDVMPDLNN